jgi:hypothetical protein
MHPIDEKKMFANLPLVSGSSVKSTAACGCSQHYLFLEFLTF